MANNIFIINPAANSGRTRKKLKSITKEIHEQDPSAKILLTHHALHAITLCKEAIKEGARRIVVIGGDGTLNEVVNGYFDKNGQPLNKNVAIAIIPGGTGSDFVRSIEHRRDLSEAIQYVLYSPAKLTDVGLVEARDANGIIVKRYFINVSSVGISGLVAGFMKTVTRKIGAKAAYFLATLKAIRALKPPTLSIHAENFETTLENCSLLSFANGQYFGSGMKIAPYAKLDDGMLDMISVQYLGPLSFLQNGVKIYDGTHIDLPNVNAHQHRHVTVKALTKDPVYVEVDGELFAELPAKYSICPNALLMVR